MLIIDLGFLGIKDVLKSIQIEAVFNKIELNNKWNFNFL